LGAPNSMEALKFLGFTLGISVAVAGALTYLVSLAINPLERMRQCWVERERDAVKAARV
jgi:hypothetical protein